MVRERVVETNEGIQGEGDVADFDVMQRTMRDRGWIGTRAILAAGIGKGHALEVGPGPGYLGLEWLRNTEGTRLTGLEISAAMIETARKNAGEYGLEGRSEYVRGDGGRLPFGDGSFDAVFSNGSLHEWADPVATLRGMMRVLKPGGRLFVSDLRRDMAAPVRAFLWISVKPPSMRPGLVTSLNASYTAVELRELLEKAGTAGGSVRTGPFGLTVRAVK